MRPSLRSSIGNLTLTRVWAGVLVLVFAQSPAFLLAEGGHTKHKSSSQTAKPLTEEERALHALNRLTFGPEPGDVERVEAIGVDKWIELQLHPERIDDSLLEAQLQKFPAMQMPLRDLILAFPSAAIIRAVADGKAGLPRNPVERAIYLNQVDDFNLRKQKQAEAAAQRQPIPGDSQPAGATPHMQEPANAGHAPAGNMQNAQGKANAMVDAMALNDVAGSPSIQAHEQKLFADLASTAIINLPPDQRWNKLVAMKPEEFRNFIRDLSNQERLEVTEGMTPQQKETVFALINPTLVVTGELLQARLLTDIYSQRQLQAVMTDFWLNHFNVYLRKGPFAPWYLVDYERNVIAPRALGKFEDLLVATAQSPAMLFYLDNHTSIGPHSLAAMRAMMNPNNKNKIPGINENYARELMELHTLGVNGGYTQRDVTEVAKVFTGWTMQDPRNGGGFVFNERRHEPGPKYVLGRTIQVNGGENGEQEGLEVLHMLATSPATAHHLSQEFAVRFVSDDPPPALVNRMAKTYLRTGGDIRQVLRTMFTSPEFWSREAYRAKVKTPEEFVISAVRATKGEVVRPILLLNAINELGMPFYGCQTPNGYSWTSAAWVNTGDLLDRMNLSLDLAGHRLGTMIDLDALMGIERPNAEPAAAKEIQLESAFLNEPLPLETREALLEQLNPGTGPTAPLRAPLPKGAGKAAGLPRRAALVQMIDLAAPVPGPADKQASLIAGLLLGSPEFQKK